MAFSNKTITDLFQQHIGVKEYDGIVRTMIEWYYGHFSKVAWCAISCSYMANKLGILDQFGGKNDNVCTLMKQTEAANKKTGKGTFKYRKNIANGSVIKRGTVIFLLKSDPPMTTTSAKHVTTAYEDFVYNGTGWFDSLGGNQDNYIKVKKYPQKQIYAIFAPDYGTAHPTLRKGDKGADVREMQKDLKKLGFGRITGHTLLAGGSFKTNTYNTVKKFQEITKCCTPDGVCGPKTWAMIDKLLATPLHTTTALTNVYVRTGPGLDYKKVAKVKEGNTAQYANIVNGWLYIPKHNGWSKSTYYAMGPKNE